MSFFSEVGIPYGVSSEVIEQCVTLAWEKGCSFGYEEVVREASNLLNILLSKNKGSEVMSKSVDLVAFEHLEDHSDRLKVPGGWIVRSWQGEGIHQIFIVDKEHSWKLEPVENEDQDRNLEDTFNR